jgi:uncharacterized membrane protein YedE/YeeE
MSTKTRNKLHSGAAFFFGAVFAVGLALSGMTRPGKVVAFLDVAGAWDPSLLLVMGGAIAVNLVLFWRTIRRRVRPLLAEKFHLPTRRDIDRPLVVGALLFGAGWGLSGLCPGTAIASIVTFDVSVLLFVAAMLAGMKARSWQLARR